MNKKHVITIVGVAFLTVGVVGGIWSGIEAMPKVINNVQIARAKQNEKEVLYNSEEEIVKLNIDATVSNVFIKRHDNPNVIVERSGEKEISNITAESKNNELTIKEEVRDITKETKNVEDIVRYVIDEMYSSHSSQIVVYLPEKVDADVKTSYTGLMVEDDILLDTLNYETSSGYITLNSDVNLKNLNIKSTSDVSLATNEISGIKNINVIGNAVYIHGSNSKEYEADVPEKLEIKTTNKYYGYYDVTINSNTPVAKNLVVDSSATVQIDLPIIDYKFNFDVKSSRGIRYESSDYEKYNNTPLEKYFEDESNEEYINDEQDKDLAKELKGLINEETQANEKEYFINVKSAYTVFN